MADKRYSAKNVASMGMLFALAMVFSFIESMMPALPALPVGVKLGLSNIVTMYCLFYLGIRKALLLTSLKSLFVFLTRAATASLMSLSGGLFSIAIMTLMLLPKKKPISLLLVSIGGAIFHNIGQLVMSAIMLSSLRTFYYLPVMVLSGVAMGSITGASLKIVMPYISKVK